MFQKILIANRGEIACRVAATARRLGIRTVAVYSDADANAKHVLACDEAVHIGANAPKESYLRGDRIIEAARATGAQAVHPGYGFLSENEDFAQACVDAGLVFIGPPPAAIKAMGLKAESKQLMDKAGVPLVPGYHGADQNPALLKREADRIGYPVLIKASAGGGGKGMRIVTRGDEFDAALASCQREARNSFGDDAVLIERYVTRPRHIEIQVFGDTQGNCLYLFERDCSVQRRHQKVLEEAPAPGMSEARRREMGAAAVAAAKAVGYVGAGTVEFIAEPSPDGELRFFFMEMNTRLQVEHPVTEAITGLDLVEWQLRVGAGEKLTFAQDDIALNGHAVEARVYAEDPARGFLPTGGPVLQVVEPSGAGVRVDSSLLSGTVVGSDYDPMLSKVIAHGADRDEALDRLDRALSRTAVLGVQTNVEFLRFLLADERVRAGDLDTALLDERLVDFAPLPAPDDVLAAGGLFRQWALARRAAGNPWGAPTGWRVGGAAPVRTAMQTPLRSETVSVWGLPEAASVQVGDGEIYSASVQVTKARMHVTLDGLRREYDWAEADRHLWIADERGTWHLREAEEHKIHRAVGARPAEVVSPMPGSVIAVQVSSGDEIAEGTVVVVIEAMKMEHSLTAPVSGRVEVLVSVGDQVKVEQVLARLTPASEVATANATESKD